MDSPLLTSLRLNGREIDLQRGIVVDEAGHTVALRPQAAEVLKVLAARPGQLVGKDDLVQAVWGPIAVTDDSLVQCVKEIRKALGDERHQIIRTVHKRGYVLEPERPAQELAPSRRRWIVPAAVAAVLAALAGLYLWPTTRPEAERPALAVLPFENISGDAKWARLADGLTEDIITDLARFRDIPVIARTSTEAYRDRPRDVREIGKALNAGYVLEGSLQVDGYRTRVTAQLVDTETGAHVWSERYDRDAGDFFAIQDQITERIAVTLTGWQGQLAEAGRSSARRKSETDLDAFDYWLLGIEAKHRMTPQSQAEARAFFDKGLKLAPDFMPLVRDMAVSYCVEMDLGSPIDYPAMVDAQRKYAERAFALDPNDASTNFMMAMADSGRGEEEQAERYRELALRLGSNNADVLMQLAWGWGGWQTDRAIALIDRTLTLNPRHPSWWNFPMTTAYFAAHRFEDAYRTAKQIGESPNQVAYVAMSAAWLGKTDEASAAAAKVLRLNPNWTAESMYPYQNFADVTLVPESASKAGLPVCMTAAQLAAYRGSYRSAACDAERAQASN
ncbi:MAG TPA: winged helix-turn-helix domain-containing protein [Rhizobiaceae bacterium]